MDTDPSQFSAVYARLCEHCGARFVARRIDRRFCSDRCRLRRWRLRKSANRPSATGTDWLLQDFTELRDLANQLAAETDVAERRQLAEQLRAVADQIESQAPRPSRSDSTV